MISGNLLRLCSLFLLSSLTLAADPAVVTSPDGHLTFLLTQDASQPLRFSVQVGGTNVVLPSRLGLKIDGQDLSIQAAVGSPTTSVIDETYPTLGVHTRAINRCQQAIFPIVSGPAKTPWQLEVRAFNDGIAYRYRVPKAGSHHLDGDVSSWVMPETAQIWYQSDLGSYEGLYTSTTVGAIKPRTTIAFPTTLLLTPGGPYVTLTEANLTDFSDAALSSAPDHTFQTFFHADAKGWSTEGEIVSPWRVTLVAPDLNTLVNTDVIHNLCPPPTPDLATAPWIQPGRSLWQWWSSGGPVLIEQRQWVDQARQLGFEYYLVDEGWKKWSKPGQDNWSLLKEVVAYATTQKVKVFAWVRTDEVYEVSLRQAYFARAKAAGLVGLKIDFPPAGNLRTIRWYVETLRDAAAAQLMIDFHGAVKPTGLDRTWPNEISREAIRGHEYQIERYHRLLPPEHDTILPFTRFVAGHADYTPTAFNPRELHGYTWPRELAQAVVFTSPFLCYADHPKYYLPNPALDVLKAIPPTWDETRVLPGSEVGKLAAFARKKGESWFIGVLNGAQDRPLHLSFQFLPAGNYQLIKIEDAPGRDDALQRSTVIVTAQDQLDLQIRAKGGFVGWLTPVVTAPKP